MFKTHQIKKIRFACFVVSAFFLVSKIPDIYCEICHNNEKEHYESELDISKLGTFIIENIENDDSFEI